MYFWIIQSDGQILPQQTVQPLTLDEMSSSLVLNKQQAFDMEIKRKLGTSIAKPPDTTDLSQFTPYEDDENGVFEMTSTDDDSYDKLVNAEVILHHQDKQSHATVVVKHLDSDGQENGRSNDNPVLDTTVYNGMFCNGTIKQYAANVIAQNMWAQVDEEGHQYLVLNSIVNHKKDETAVEKPDQYIVTKQGRKKLRQTTTGWYLSVQWKTGEQQWIPLKDLKE